MKRLTRIRIANLVLFQVGWAACVVGAARGYPWIGPLAVAGVVALHLAWADRPRLEARLLLACALIGVAFDSLLLATGWVGFPNGWWLAGLAPYWMGFMWLLFGTTLNLSLAWLKGRHLLAAVFGAVGGPLAYLAGQRLGGIQFLDSSAALIALAAGWGAVTPLLLRLAGRLNGFSEPELPDFIVRDPAAKQASNHA